MTLEDLKEQPPGVLDSLPVEIIYNLQTQALEHAASVAQMLGILHSTLSRKYATGINGFGTTNKTDGGYQIKITIPKNVSWDQEKMLSAVKKITDEWQEDPADYVKCEYSISETSWKGWPPVIKALFQDARTEKAGKAKIELTEKELEPS